MNIRVALLIMAAWLAPGGARAALQSLDPDRVPIASVDRFSNKAGTLLVRSADKRLRGHDVVSLLGVGLGAELNTAVWFPRIDSETIINRRHRNLVS